MAETQRYFPLLTPVSDTLKGAPRYAQSVSPDARHPASHLSGNLDELIADRVRFVAEKPIAAKEISGADGKLPLLEIVDGVVKATQFVVKSEAVHDGEPVYKVTEI